MRSSNLAVKRYAAPSHLLLAALVFALLSCPNIQAASIPTNAYDAQFNRVPFAPPNPQAALTGEAVIDFQWYDPYAYTKQSIGKLLLNEKGQLPSPASSITYSFQTTSDNELVRIEAGPVQTSGSDVTVAIFDSQGKLLLTAPDYRLPAELGLPASGSYSVVVSAHSPVVGEFYVKINQVNLAPSPEVTSNSNLLLFDVIGTFVTSLLGDALATKEPILFQAFFFPFNFQLVTSFAGSFANQIGAVWTPLDGYGFINAQEAVKAPLKK